MSFAEKAVPMEKVRKSKRSVPDSLITLTKANVILSPSTGMAGSLPLRERDRNRKAIFVHTCAK